VARALRTREAGVYAVTGATLRRFATSDEHLAVLRAMDPSRLLVAPLIYKSARAATPTRAR
jgi:hypothetical protein